MVSMLCCALCHLQIGRLVLNRNPTNYFAEVRENTCNAMLMYELLPEVHTA
jgi:catalase